MKRRAFLVQSAWAVGGALVAGRLRGQGTPAAPTAPPAAAPLFTVLREGVGTFTGRGGTIGWLATDEALLAIDTQFPDTAELFLAQLPRRGGRRLDLVIDTHHHGDHTGGNPVFRGATSRILAHDNVPELMRAAAARGGRELDPATLPTETTPGGVTLDVGRERVRIDYFGPAHTKGDIVVTLERANVVHVGDLLFNRLYPVIDRPGGASIRGWIGVLEKLAHAYGDDTTFIFGHGNPKFGVTGTRADLGVFRNYLSGLLEHVQREIAAGKTKEQIVALENLPGFDDFHAARPNRLGGNLAVAYDELTSGA